MFDVVPDDLQLSKLRIHTLARISSRHTNAKPADVTSSIVYDDNASFAPSTTVEAYHEFPDQSIVPIIVEAQAEPDVKIELGVFFDTATDGTNRAFFNNVTYRTPIVPAYLTAISMGEDAMNPAIYGQTNSFVLRHGDNVELYVTVWQIACRRSMVDFG